MRTRHYQTQDGRRICLISNTGEGVRSRDLAGFEALRYIPDANVSECLSRLNAPGPQGWGAAEHGIHMAAKFG